MQEPDRGFLTFQLKPGSTIIIGDVLVHVKRVGWRQVRLLFGKGTQVKRLELLSEEEQARWLSQLPDDCAFLAKNICEQYKKRRT